jgi:hypothetical protein
MASDVLPLILNLRKAAGMLTLDIRWKFMDRSNMGRIPEMAPLVKPMVSK